MNTTYEIQQAFSEGYEAFRAGYQSKYYRGSDSGWRVMTALGKSRYCDSAELEHAKSYADGFMRAEEDSHE